MSKQLTPLVAWQQLAREASRTRHNGTRKRRAQRAWTALTAAGNAGNQAAADAVWQSWLADPDDERWELLVRWRGAGWAIENACGVAMAAGGDAVARFCASHRLAPADPVRRTVFYLLTGQNAAVTVADPDGSLLTLGYAGAPDPVKARIRDAMTRTSGLNIMLVVAGGDPRLRVPAMTGEEVRYLAGQLAAHRDWAGLWWLTARLPLVDAVTAMREFGDGWRPADAASRALFQALAQVAGHAEPAALAQARAAVAAIRADGAPRSIRISVPGLSTGYLHQGALTADGKRLAVDILAHDREECDIAIVSLRDSMAPGEVERYRVAGSVVALAFAEDTLIALSLQSTGPRARAIAGVVEDGGGQAGVEP